jgi:hypothetical protein
MLSISAPTYKLMAGGGGRFGGGFITGAMFGTVMTATAMKNRGSQDLGHVWDSISINRDYIGDLRNQIRDNINKIRDLEDVIQDFKSRIKDLESK